MSVSVGGGVSSTPSATTGVAQIAELDGDAEPVVVTAVLPDERAIRTAQGVAANQLALIGGESQERLALGGIEHFAPWHECPY